jgi:hypothetical protein
MSRFFMKIIVIARTNLTLHTLLLGMVLGSTIRADEVPSPKTPPPSFVLVSKVDRANSSIVIVSPVIEQVPYTQIAPNGQTVTTMKVVTKWIESTSQMASVRILDAEGHELVGEKAWKQLEVGRMVLRTNGTEPLDPAYLKVLAKDAVIVVPRPALDSRE